jgi:hypothetical protein
MIHSADGSNGDDASSTGTAAGPICCDFTSDVGRHGKASASSRFASNGTHDIFSSNEAHFAAELVTTSIKFISAP